MSELHGRPDEVDAVARPAAPDQLALASALRVGRVEALVVVGVLVVAAVAAAWWFLRSPAASLEIDGEPIANAQQLLDTADPVFRAIAQADGADLVDGAGCWFAPPAADATDALPRVACGPVALGIAGNNQRWLIGRASFQRSFDGTGYQATFGEFIGVAQIDRGALRRPDGKGPPDAELVPASDGVRTESGRRLTDVDAALDAADAAFTAAADQQGAAVGKDSRCYLDTRDTAGRRIATGGLICGPVLLLGSAAEDTWTRFDVQFPDGALLVEASVTVPDIRSISATGPIPAGTTLYRPDGAAPPSGGPALRPPDAPAQEPGFVGVYDRAGLSTAAAASVEELDAPADGRLRTPSVEVTVTGLGRLDRVGAGETALVAADGEVLVVAAFDSAVPPEGPSGGATASTVVDGRRVALPDGARLPEKGLLVVSVPTRAATADFEILSAGRRHTISLLSGERPPDASTAPYRQVPVQGQASPLSVEVALSAGDPVRIAGAVTSSAVTGWTPADGYAPDGSAFLTLSISDWAVDPPSGQVSVDDITVAWRLLLPDGQQVSVAPVPATGFSETAVTFVVPVDVVIADLVADVSVAYSPDGTDGAGPSATASSPPATVDLPR